MEMNVLGTVTKMDPVQYMEQSGTDISDIQVCEGKMIVAVYVGDDDCPFTGAEYDDGSFSICGLGCDSEVTKDEMVSLLANY